MNRILRKPFLLLLLNFIMIANAFAATVVTVGSLKYELDGVWARVVGYVGSPTNVVIPETIVSEGQTFKVSQVKPQAFENCNSITSLKSMYDINICYYAFRNCPNLKEVNLYVNTFIGEAAFQNCSNLQKVKLIGVIEIYPAAFKNCANLQFVYLGDELEMMGADAFVDCTKLTYVVIPASCTKYKYYSNDNYYSWNNGHDVFTGCSRLQSIIYLGDQTGTGGSNAKVYHAADWGSWSQTTFNYTGKAPNPTFSYTGGVAGFKVSSYSLSTLKKDAGTYTTTVPVKYANNDMSFTVDRSLTYTINPVQLTAKVKDVSRQYGNSNPTFSSTYTGFVNGETASVITSHGTYTTSATANSDVGTYTIKQSDAKAKNYVFKYQDGKLTVNKAPLTMTAKDKTMVYGDNVPTLDVTYTGLKNNETEPKWTTTPSITTTATKKSKVGTYPITITNAVPKNYTITTKNGTLTVNKASLTAKVADKSRLYGDPNPTFTITYTGLKNNETAPEWEQQPSFETSATPQSNVGSYAVNLKNALAVNYVVTTSSGKLTVKKAPLKVKPKDATRKYGEKNPSFELLFDGLKNSENQPEWTTDPVITTTATRISQVGEYPTQVKSGEARNYTLEVSSGTLVVTKAPLTIKLMDATRKYGMANPNFEMSYTGLVNDETNPAWTTFPNIKTTASEKSDVGDYPITATGGEMKNYEFDDITPGVLTVTPASLVIRAQDASKTYYDANPPLNYICMGFAQGDDAALFTVHPQLTTTATQQSPVGVYPIEVGGAEIKNYQVTYEKGQLTVDKRTLTVSTNDYTREYGEENPEFELYYKGFVNNEDENVLVSKPKATTFADKNTDTGVYDITIGNGVAENYAFTYIGGKLTIEKAYQTLTWDQEFTSIEQYDQVELTATASSGLEVQYTLQDNDICSIVRIGRKLYLDCYGEGETVLIAQQEGNKNYWQTTKMYRKVKIGGDTGIAGITMQMDGTEQIFDANGRRIQKLQHGVNIIRMKNGTTKKLVVK